MSQNSDAAGPSAPSSPLLPPVGEVPRPTRDPFRAFGIIGFAMSFFAIINIAGLVISIVAVVRSKRAGFKNRFALAGAVVSSIGVIITICVAAFVVSTLVGTAQTCARLGEGIHAVGSATYTCTSDSFYVSYGSMASAPPSDEDAAEWVTANALYAEATCPTNAAREELFAAVDTNDLARIAPVAASASQAFEAAAEVFLENSWPPEIEEDIRFLGDTSEALADSWGEVATSADIDDVNAVPFPDAQTPFEAAQRIRAGLSEHGQVALEC